MLSGRREGPAPHAPTWWPELTIMGVAWADGDREVPIEVEDGDGCKALVLGPDESVEGSLR